MNDKLRFRGFAIGAAGRIIQPFQESIESQAATALAFVGGYGSARSAGFSYRGILKFDLAQSQVTGLPCDCDDEETSSVANIQSTVEGLNILDMVTADRVIANLVSTYPAPKGEPSILFFGSRFENLRIAGIPIDIDIAAADPAEGPLVRLIVPERAGLRVYNNAIEVAGFGTVTLATATSSGSTGSLCMIQVDLRCPHRGHIQLCCIDGGIDPGGE